VLKKKKRKEERRRKKKERRKEEKNLAEKPRGEHGDPSPHKGQPGRREDHWQEGDIPNEVLRGADLLKGHKGKGLCKGAEQNVLVEEDREDDLNQELGEKGQEANEIRGRPLKAEIEVVEVHREVVPVVLAGDVVQVRLLQELKPVQIIHEPCEGEEGAGTDEPKLKPRGVEKAADPPKN